MDTVLVFADEWVANRASLSTIQNPEGIGKWLIFSIAIIL